MSTDVSSALFGTQRGDLVSEDFSLPRTMLGTGSETRLSLASLWQEATYLDCLLWCSAKLFSYHRPPEMVGQGEYDVEGLDEQEADEQAVEDGVEFGATWWRFHFN